MRRITATTRLTGAAIVALGGFGGFELGAGPLQARPAAESIQAVTGGMSDRGSGAGRPAPAPPPGPSQDPSVLARDGMAKMLQALELMIQSIPRYGPPEITEDGDIILRRQDKPVPRLPRRPRDSRSGPA